VNARAISFQFKIAPLISQIKEITDGGVVWSAEHCSAFQIANRSHI
jgi:hypothetical protein